MRRSAIEIDEADRAPHGAARGGARAAALLGAGATATTTTGGRTTVPETSLCRLFA
jgi:hypothetical protein